MYKLHNECLECLEHYLLFLDVGFANATSGFFAGLWHVTKDQRTSQFQKLARLHCMARYDALLEAQ